MPPPSVAPATYPINREPTTYNKGYALRRCSPRPSTHLPSLRYGKRRVCWKRCAKEFAPLFCGESASRPWCTSPYKFTIDPYNKVTANCYCNCYGTININSIWYSLNRSEQYMLILPADARTIIINKAKEYGYGG